MNIEEIYQLYNQFPIITTDSRTVPAGSLYFALKGEYFDGNTFAEDALKKGAVYAIIDNKNYYKGEQYILVDDSLETLQNIARLHRKTINIKILAITGSNGKTTSKELIHAVLSRKYSVKSTSGNLNNEIGVPLTLLSMSSKNDIGVVEMGANHIHEIEKLCNIACPDFGIITNIGKAHLEGFGGYQGVIKAKSELYNYLINNKGVVFYNADNNLLVSLLNEYSNKTGYGFIKGDICKGKIISVNPYLTIEIQKVNNNVINESCVISSHLFGDYNAENIIAACATGVYFNVPLNETREAIENYYPQNNRSQIMDTLTNKLIIDCYNSNPSSCETAIRNFVSLQGTNKTVILGDMYELGDYAIKEHEKILDLISLYKDLTVYLVGNIFKSLAIDFRLPAFSTTNELKSWLIDNPLTNSLILIKGSRGNKLETIVDLL